MYGRMVYFLESYILNLTKRFFGSAVNGFKFRCIRSSESCQPDIRYGFSLHLHFRTMRIYSVSDEPASGLDPLFRKELMGYLQEIVEDGTRGVLMSTHLTEDLDRIGRLHCVDPERWQDCMGLAN